MASRWARTAAVCWQDRLRGVHVFCTLASASAAVTVSVQLYSGCKEPCMTDQCGCDAVDGAGEVRRRRAGRGQRPRLSCRPRIRHSLHLASPALHLLARQASFQVESTFSFCFHDASHFGFNHPDAPCPSRLSSTSPLSFCPKSPPAFPTHPSNPSA